MSITSPVGRTRRKRVRPAERVDVVCSECGSDFTVSRRTFRYHTEGRANTGKGAGGTPFLCSLCRAFDAAPSERRRCCSRRDYGWWLRRFTLPELDAILGSIWGPAALTPAARQRRETIAASAAPHPEKRAA